MAGVLLPETGPETARHQFALSDMGAPDTVVVDVPDRLPRLRIQDPACPIPPERALEETAHRSAEPCRWMNTVRNGERRPSDEVSPVAGDDVGVPNRDTVGAIGEADGERAHVEDGAIVGPASGKIPVGLGVDVVDRAFEGGGDKKRVEDLIPGRDGRVERE